MNKGSVPLNGEAAAILRGVEPPWNMGLERRDAKSPLVHLARLESVQFSLLLNVIEILPF